MSNIGQSLMQDKIISKIEIRKKKIKHDKFKASPPRIHPKSLGFTTAWRGFQAPLGGET